MVDSSRYIALALQREKMAEDSRLADRALKERSAQRQADTMASLASTLGRSAASAYGSYAQGQAQSKNDGIANSLMNQQENIPRAQAAGPNAQAVQTAADSKAANMDGFHTGGVAEMKLSMSMEDQKNQNIANRLAGVREARLTQQADDTYTLRQRQSANQAAQLTNQKTKDAVTTSGAYFKNKALIEKSMSEAQAAGDFDAYDSAAQDLQALHYGTVSAGIKLPELRIPGFRDPNAPQPEAVQDAADSWENSRNTAMQPGGWNSNGKWLNGKTAGQEFMDESRTLSDLQQKSKPREVSKFQPSEDVITMGQGQASGGGAVEMARQAIAAGANPQAVAERLRAMGIDPATINQ